MILLVDEGNTRIKAWWLDDAGRVIDQGIHASMAALMAVIDESAHGLTRIGLASVRGAASCEAWQAAAAARQLSLEMARVDPARLPTRYARPERLGIDRWLAVLAVAEYREPALIVDAGTAVTFDVFMPDAGHVGGYILPGLRLQREVLAAQTARVSFPEPDWSDLALGVDTAGCVGKGGLRALVALVRDIRHDLPSSAVVWLAGGDSMLLKPWLADARPAPDLLLRGMAVYFGVPLAPTP